MKKPKNDRTKSAFFAGIFQLPSFWGILYEAVKYYQGDMPWL
jgi:hypothetical protein